mmetsp:Transcript_40575/g.65239  ORF Transcript_40575/g.65239 Transcript_40575/m.65239 type:complete len:794 (-) Transcript_40575:219-2600(-)
MGNCSFQQRVDGPPTEEEMKAKMGLNAEDVDATERAYMLLRVLREEQLNLLGFDALNFALEELKRNDGPLQNVVVSPIAVTIVLLMLQSATYGSTKRELVRAFGDFEKIIPKLHKEQKKRDDMENNTHKDADWHEIHAEKSSAFCHSIWIPGDTKEDFNIKLYKVIGGDAGNRTTGSYFEGRVANAGSTRLTALFDELDKNENNELSVDEFIKLNNKCFEHLSEEEFFEECTTLHQQAIKTVVRGTVEPRELRECKGCRKKIAAVIFDSVLEATGSTEDEIEIHKLADKLNIYFLERKAETLKQFNLVPYKLILKEMKREDIKFINKEDFIDFITINCRAKVGDKNYCSGEDFTLLATDLLFAARSLAHASSPVAMQDCESREEMLELVFTALDDDNSGYLSKEEFIEQLGRPNAKNSEPIDWWVKKKTHEEVEKIYGTKLRGVSAVTTSVIHCSPTWHVKFELGLDPEWCDDCQFRPDLQFFRVSRTHKVRTQFMHLRWVKCPYLVTKDAYVTHLKLKNQKEGVLIAIARDNDNFEPPSLEKLLKRPKRDRRGRVSTEYNTLKSLVSTMYDEKRIGRRCITHMSLPMGEIEHTVNMAPKMAAWGCKRILEETRDWGPAFKSEKEMPAKLSGITQKTIITLAPKGERAQLAMDIADAHGSGMTTEQKTVTMRRHFIANKPFLMVIHREGKIIAAAHANCVSNKGHKLEAVREYTWGSSLPLSDNPLENEDEDYLEVSLEKREKDGTVRLVQALDADDDDNHADAKENNSGGVDNTDGRREMNVKRNAADTKHS